MSDRDLISRSALMLHIAGTKIHLKGDGDWISGYRDALQAIGELVQTTLAVDAVEVCRCKDCKHRRNDEDYASGHYCVKRPSNGGYFCEDNDFCSYGERRVRNERS